jgi:glyoxylase-like metal-dependent hydrolase (beta-lactamase superfamily II)
MTIHPIDLQFQGSPGIIASWLLIVDGEAALVETGPSTCRRALVEGLRGHGVSVSDVKKVFLTHIHLDHAGDAGWWAGQGATVYVHPLGAPHVIDPTRLVESATRVYQDQMQRLWGEIPPAPAENVVAISDNEAIPLGSDLLLAWDTPGHARHHLVWCIAGHCFTGDVAGVRLENSLYLSVAAAPPQFEPPEYLASVQRLRDARFKELHLTHFGTVTDPEPHLVEYARRIEEVTLTVEQAPGQYGAVELQRARARGVSDELWRRYELANGTEMSSVGITRYLSRANVQR